MTPPAPALSVRWSFLAVAGVRVQCPIALDNGVARPIGQRFDPATGEYAPTGEPHAYALAKRDAAYLRAFFAKALRLGQIAPGDAATAAAFGVPFPSTDPLTGAAPHG